MRRLWIAAIATLFALPVQAGKLQDAVPDMLRAYADQAGYVLASIKLCGGDTGEEDYFRALVRDNLAQIGADDDDIGFLDHYMAAAAAAAKPKKSECTDDGAVPMTAEMFGYRNAMRKALKSD
ncbi:MAG: hypothetical protein HQ481_16240 [Alphaproteobacteria bacterium]|nr:hypothetical protein [Alphaproteobacteria bacterium]